MLSDTISPDLLLIFVIGLCGLMLFVYLDRYFTNRRSVLVNERYAQRLLKAEKILRCTQQGLIIGVNEIDLEQI